ncbi:hypothetical protein QT971_30360 [Microcoleus sp. herbarium19]|uniref:hypothetical protein n=1 Tax=unclassified Microcoleus TaxID=2642155 RepID=UPI002FD67A52
MISENQLKSSEIGESKIIHKSSIVNPRSRFVTEETVALLFNISPEQIYRIECCHNMVYVYAKGLSRFLSYADFPPIVEVNPPATQDFLGWYKRWNAKLAPQFWTQFYTYNFKEAVSVDSLLEWGKLVGTVKSVISASALQQLRDVYAQEKALMENF